MRYIYLPKLLNDLANLEKHRFTFDYYTFQMPNLNVFEEVNHSSHWTVEEVLEGTVCRYDIYQGLEDDPALSFYMPNFDAAFAYGYGKRSHRYIHPGRLIRSICQTLEDNVPINTALPAHKLCGAVIAVLTALADECTSPEAFKATLQDVYQIPLNAYSVRLAMPTCVNSHLDQPEKLSRYLSTFQGDTFQPLLDIWSHVDALLATLAEIDWWLDRADKHRLNAYTSLLTNEQFADINIDETYSDYYRPVFDYSDKILDKIRKIKATRTLP